MTSLTHNRKIAAILMQYDVSEWTIYIPFIQSNENLLVLRGTTKTICCKFAFFNFGHVTRFSKWQPP